MKTILAIITFLSSLSLSLRAPAQNLVYDNGPVVGPVSYLIGEYSTVSDSFTVTGPTALSSAHTYLSVASFGIPATVNWRIGTTLRGAEVSSGFANLAITNSGGGSIYDCAFQISGNVASGGIYYLTLSNALSSVGGGDVYWWVANGPSSAYQYPDLGEVPSESFTLYGESVCKDQTVCNDESQCGAAVSFGPLVGTNWPGYVVSIDPPSGSFFAVGTNTVTWTAVSTGSDRSTNMCSFQVIVNDCEAPIIQSITATPDSLWPPNHTLRPVTLHVSTTDNCHLSSSRIVAVSSSEPVVSPGSGSTSPDWQITGDLTVNLRAERSGTGTGRIYTIVVECADDAGNKSQGTTQVTIPH